MKAFAAYLRKEIRDGRTMLIGIPTAIVVAVALAVALAVGFIPGAILVDPVFPHVIALGAFVLAVLAIAPDLLPGEARRGKMEFLSRLPSGLGAAYGAKVVYLIGVALLMPIVGYAVGGLAGVLSGGEFAWPASGLRFQTWPVALLIAAVLAIAGWTFAISSWLPRSMLTIPTAALVLTGFSLPVVLILLSAPGFTPDKHVAIVLLAAFCAWPWVVGWLSFSRGRRFGRGPWSAAWRGLIATALLFIPAWGYAAVAAHDWNHVDPADERCSFESGYLGEGGRLVFLNAHMERGSRNTTHTLVIDLEDGSWRQVGGTGDEFSPVGAWRIPFMLRTRSGALPVVERFDCRASTLRGEVDHPGIWMHYHDGATGEVFKSGWSHLRHEVVEKRAPRSASLVPEGHRAWTRKGLGYSLVGGGLYDPFRARVYSGREIRAHGIGWSNFIRPGRWLVREKNGNHNRYVLFDPDSGETAPVEGFDLTWISWILDDGRAVTLDPETRTVIALDPETGARQNIGLDAPVNFLMGRTPGKGYVVTGHDVRDSASRITHARLDAETLEVAMFPAIGGDGSVRFTLIAAPDEDTLIGIWDARQIIRVRVGDESREVLFPR
jgi:MFS family permease